MTVIMRDSTNPAAIPTDTPIVAGYVDGIFGPLHAQYGQTGWDAAAWAGFPNSLKRRIAAVSTDTPSDVADIESGDLTPIAALSWYRNMTALGIGNLWLYVNRSNQRIVEDVFWNSGIRDVKVWVATLDGTQAVAQYRYPVAAVQYIDHNGYDESVVYDSALFGQLPDHAEDDMPLRYVRGPQPPGEVWVLGDSARHIGPLEWQDVAAKGATAEDISAAYIAEIKAGAAVTVPALDSAPILAAIANLQAHPAVVADPALLAVVNTIESQLKAGLKLDVPLGAIDIKGTVGA